MDSGSDAVARPPLIRPGLFGLFGLDVAADRRRSVFDLHNESLLAKCSPIDAVFIGDSITDMWALDAFFTGGSGGLLVNRGIGGDRTPFLCRRFEADALQLQPRLIILLIGVNNTWDLDLWDTPELMREPPEIADEIITYIGTIVGAAGERRIPLAICSILPTNIPLLTTNETRNRLIARANVRLRDLASRAGIPYVDYHSALVGEDGITLRPNLADDGLHPHVLGYEIMARVLLETLHEAGITSIQHGPEPARMEP